MKEQQKRGALLMWAARGGSNPRGVTGREGVAALQGGGEEAEAQWG